MEPRTYEDMSLSELKKHLYMLVNNPFSETESTILARKACVAAIIQKENEEKAVQRDDQGLQS